MKKVLFYTTYAPSPTHGGIEHVTLRIAEGLSSNEIQCFCLYKHEVSDATKDVFFDCCKIDSLDPENFISEYIFSNRIDIVVVQGQYNAYTSFYDDKVKVIFVHHSSPSYEIDIFNLDYLYYKIKTVPIIQKPIYIRQLILFPIYYIYIKKQLIKQKRFILAHSDKIVLISKNAIEEFMKLANVKDNFEKVTYINNPLSYDFYLDDSEIKSKKNCAIIVCRMEEETKKISHALRVWNEIEKDQSLKDWELLLIGDGPDLNTYKSISIKYKLRRVKFLGKRSPLPYYKESSLFFMTSISESWGVTITEAMQMGCVPIVYDSFAAVHDIIQDGVSGFLIRYGDVVSFKEVAKKLMLDKNLREEMAINAIKTSKRFEMGNVCHAWSKLIKYL